MINFSKLINFGLIATGITTCITTCIIGLYTYHYSLLIKKTGEVKVKWSSIPILGDAIEFGQRPMQYLLEQSSNSNKNNNTISKIFGILIAGQRMFFIKDPVDFNMIFRCDKTKVNYIYIYIYICTCLYICM